jgi:hypothetical protein
MDRPDVNGIPHDEYVGSPEYWRCAHAIYGDLKLDRPLNDSGVDEHITEINDVPNDSYKLQAFRKLLARLGDGLVYEESMFEPNEPGWYQRYKKKSIELVHREAHLVKIRNHIKELEKKLNNAGFIQKPVDCTWTEKAYSKTCIGKVAANINYSDEKNYRDYIDKALENGEIPIKLSSAKRKHFANLVWLKNKRPELTFEQLKKELDKQ